MSGHSKWSKVKHQKAVTDVVKSAAFTKASRAISLAVKQSGGIGDPDKNFKLRLAIDQARAVNMPKENIERAIDKAIGKDTLELHEAIYEVNGPGNSALIIESTTDNLNRTVSTIKNILDRYNGKLLAPGTLHYLFKQCGVVVIKSTETTFDNVLEKVLDLGADDVLSVDGFYEIYTKVSDLSKIKIFFEKEGIEVDNAEIIMHPLISIELNSEMLDKNNLLIEKLEELEDIQKVFTNIKT